MSKTGVVKLEPVATILPPVAASYQNTSSPVPLAVTVSMAVPPQFMVAGVEPVMAKVEQPACPQAVGAMNRKKAMMNVGNKYSLFMGGKFFWGCFSIKKMLWTSNVINFIFKKSNIQRRFLGRQIQAYLPGS
jgi:hypothetical protein